MTFLMIENTSNALVKQVVDIGPGLLGDSQTAVQADPKRGLEATRAGLATRVNYPTLLALTRSLRVGLPASKTRFAGTTAVPAGSAVSISENSATSTIHRWKNNSLAPAQRPF